jgi:cation:H+ antiporter
VLLIIQSVVCVVLVVVVGTRLSQSADVLAEKTNLGRTWVGSVLLAGATSLPELATGISAVTVFDAPDLAAGGIFGSCLSNLFILAILDIVSGSQPLLGRVQSGHALAAGMGSILLGTAAAGMLLAQTSNNLVLGWVGIPSLALIWLYLISMRILVDFELKRRAEVLEEEANVYQYQHIKSRQAYLTFALLSIAIVVLGVWLASLGDRIATATGLGESFIGALLLATTTSLPEAVAAFAAIRLDALDLAVSNLFGSNIFNLAILGIYDLAYLRGDFWANISGVHLFTAIVAIIMTSVAIVGLIYRAARPARLYITWDGVALIALYLGGMYFIYRS